MHEVGPEDPRIARSDKTYIGYKALGMGFDAHLTVMYLGQISKLQEDLAVRFLKDHAEMFMFNDYMTARRLKISMFGPNNNIPVVEVAVPNGLHKLRDDLENHSYLPSPSEFAWNPHITLKINGDDPIFIPSFITLTHLGLY